MKGKIHLHPNANTNGFDKNPQNISGKGRAVSIKKQIEDLLVGDGSLTIPVEQVVKVNNDGSVVIKVPTQEAMAMKLLTWAMSSKGTDSIKAIQIIMDYFDKKEPTSVEVTTETHDKDLAEKLMNMVYNPVTKKFESCV